MKKGKLQELPRICITSNLLDDDQDLTSSTTALKASG
jgi:hypothetical protein